MTDLEKLMANGISETIAKSLLANLSKSNTAKKKPANKWRGFPKSYPKSLHKVSVTRVCSTCGNKTEYTKEIECTEKEVNEERFVHTGLCENCIKMLGDMTKAQLVSLLIIQNHPDISIRTAPSSLQLKLAKTKSAIEWLHFNHKERDAHVEEIKTQEL